MWRRSSRTVLIVSDDQRGCSFRSAFLQHPKIRLLNSRADSDGLRLARTERPSLIIEELFGDCGPGLEFCSELRGAPGTCSIPLIMVVPPELKDDARDACPDQLLLRPVPHRDLFRAVRRYIPLPERKFKRLSVNLRFEYDKDERCAQAFSRDVSLNGAFLKTDRILPIGTQLDVRFCIPGSWEQIACRAIVRGISHGDGHNNQQRGFGIEFEDLEDADAQSLESFIDNRLDRPFLAR